MAVAYRNKDVQGNGNGTSVVHSAPAGLADNDIICLFLYKENNATVTVPSGFSTPVVINESTHLWIYYSWKRASSESGTYTFSWTGSTFRYSTLAAYSGAITSGDPNDATPTTTSNATETNQITCPSITTVTANCLIIPFGASYIADLTAGALTGYVVRESALAELISDATDVSPGATGTLVYTHSGGADHTAGITIALKPADVSSVSPSSSLSPSISPSSSVSASPSTGYTGYTSGNYGSLPATDNDLSHVYSAQDVTDVSTNNSVRVPQVGTLQYMVHQFKDFVGSATTRGLMCDCQSDLAPSSSTVYLQIYNHNTSTWTTIASNSTAAANTDFVLQASVNLTNYKDASNVISCRIYQLAI